MRKKLDELLYRIMNAPNPFQSNTNEYIGSLATLMTKMDIADLNKQLLELHPFKDRHCSGLVCHNDLPFRTLHTYHQNHHPHHNNEMTISPKKMLTNTGANATKTPPPHKDYGSVEEFYALCKIIEKNRSTFARMNLEGVSNFFRGKTSLFSSSSHHSTSTTTTALNHHSADIYHLSQRGPHQQHASHQQRVSHRGFLHGSRDQDPQEEGNNFQSGSRTSKLDHHDTRHFPFASAPPGKKLFFGRKKYQTEILTSSTGLDHKNKNMTVTNDIATVRKKDQQQNIDPWAITVSPLVTDFGRTNAILCGGAIACEDDDDGKNDKYTTTTETKSKTKSKTTTKSDKLLLWKVGETHSETFTITNNYQKRDRLFYHVFPLYDNDGKETVLTKNSTENDKCTLSIDHGMGMLKRGKSTTFTINMSFRTACASCVQLFALDIYLEDKQLRKTLQLFALENTNDCDDKKVKLHDGDLKSNLGTVMEKTDLSKKKDVVTTAFHTSNVGGLEGSGEKQHCVEIFSPLEGKTIAISIPSFLVALRSKLFPAARKAEGIFRIPGDSEKITSLKTMINTNYTKGDLQGISSDIIGGANDVHIWAGLLKLWFRSLPGSSQILPDSHRVPVASVITCNSIDDALGLLKKLEIGKQHLVIWLVDVLREIVICKDQTRMSIENCSVVFGPNLFIPDFQGNTMEALMMSQKTVQFLKFVLQKTHEMR
eukprot:g3142.t1